MRTVVIPLIPKKAVEWKGLFGYHRDGGYERIAEGSMTPSHTARRLSAILVADAVGLPVAASQSPEPVLLGAAMLGAVAAGRYADFSSAMPAMSRLGEVFRPATGAMRAWHDKRYEAFLALQAVGRSIR